MEDDERKRMTAAIQAATERVRSGEVESAEITTPDGTVMRLSRDPVVPGGFRVESDGADRGKALTARTYPALEDRPASYPAALPFLPQCAVSVTEVGSRGMRSAIWMNPPDAGAAFESIRNGMTALGWIQRPVPEPPMPVLLGPLEGRQLLFDKHGCQGTLMHRTFNDVSQIMWLEGGSKTDDDADAPA
jgi:hypothetical protein